MTITDDSFSVAARRRAALEDPIAMSPEQFRALRGDRPTGTVHWPRGGSRACDMDRHVATLRSFTSFARRKGWLADDPAAVLERRTVPADRTRAIAATSLARRFRRSLFTDNAAATFGL